MITIALLLFSLSLQTTPIQDVQLSVSFREQVQGQARGNAIYVLEVSCRDGECVYAYVGLNNCRTIGPERQGFHPLVEIVSRTNADLRVSNDGSILTLEETGTDSFGEWTNTFHIGYEPTEDGAPATRVVSFSGSFVKTSELIRLPTRIDYVPLEGPFQPVDLECALLAPGTNPG